MVQQVVPADILVDDCRVEMEDLLMETSAINADNDPCVRKQIVFAFKVSDIFKPGSMLVQTVH